MSASSRAYVSAAPDAEVPPVSTAGPRLVESLRVLVVEDDPDVLQALTDVLLQEGFRVTSASNGADALQQLDGGAMPSLILLDLMMPGMDGYEFLQHRHDRPELQKVPVVVVSATADSRFMQAGVEVLRKPVDVDTLLRAVARQVKHAAG